MKYNEGFKKNIVEKMLTPGVSVTEISKEIGVSTNTLYNWRKKFSNPIAQQSWHNEGQKYLQQ